MYRLFFTTLLIGGCTRSNPPATTTSPPASASGAEVAQRLASDPVFVRAVADQVAAQVMRDLSARAPSVTVPVAGSAQSVTSAFVVAITAAGEISIDGRPYTDATLGAEAARRHALDANTRAVIAADARLSHEAVVHVIDVLRVAGITRFAIQVAPAAPTP